MRRLLFLVAALAPLFLGRPAPAAPAGVERPPAGETAIQRAIRWQAWRDANRDIGVRLARTARDTAAQVAAYRRGATGAAGVGAPPVILRTRDAGITVWDCAECPPLVIVPAGVFTIGSPDDEPGRGKDEAPRRRVAILHALAVGRFEVTLTEYQAFLDATRRAVQGGCLTDRAQKGTWAPDAATNLHDLGYAQSDDHPVVCVTWDDAQAYVDWLNSRTQGGYRLPSEAEWEYLARAGTTAAYPWGPSADAGCAYANNADATARASYPSWTVAACEDGATNSWAVGSGRPNGFGLYDVIGNVGEWVQDCATMSYVALPADGAPNLSGDCARTVVRSGSWGAIPKDSRVANRVRYPRSQVDDSIGIRVVRTIG